MNLLLGDVAAGPQALRRKNLSPVLRAAAVVAAVIFCAGPAAAQVAIAVIYPLEDPSLRDSASGVVDEVVRRWEPTAEPLGASEVAGCKDDSACLLSLARARQASHLAVIGVGTLGRVRIVTARLFDREGVKLYDEVYTTPAGLPSVDDGKPVGQRLVQVSGPPPRTSPLPELRTGNGLTALSWIGAGVMAASAVGAVAVGTVATTQLVTNGGAAQGADRAPGTDLAIGAAVIGGVGLTLGAALIVTDAFIE